MYLTRSVTRSILTLGLIGVVSLAGAVRWASAAPKATESATSSRVDDSTLKARIAAKFRKNTRLAARDLDVAVDQGVVTLRGVVRTLSDKTRATRLATIHGVASVNNEIVVDATAARSTARKVADATEDAAQKTVDTTKEIAGKTAHETKKILSATGEEITDGWITTKVKAKFADEALLKGSDLHVDTNDKVVTLQGTAVSRQARARAAEIARGTEGVARVVDEVVIR